MGTVDDTQDNIRVSGSITYDAFYHNYLLPNRPAIFTHRLVESWPAFELWTSTTTSDSESTSAGIDWTYLLDHYGEDTVSVADCSKRDTFGNLECEPHTLRHVLELWTQGGRCGEHLYVKDWHLPRRHESDALGQSCTPFYTTPEIFADDWMNAFYTAHTDDDFRFVYLSGSAGVFTPLHRDVYGSYSWSTNIVGRKRWWLFPPEQTPYLFMKNRKRVCVQDVRCVDESEFSEFGKTRPIVVEQEPGETIFVPSGWYHQVENLTACISINHNWSNAVNLPTLYALMCDKVEEVEEALDDVREMIVGSSSSGWQEEFTKIVQDVVRHDAGWNWLTFWRMVRYALQSIQDTSQSAMDTENHEEHTTGLPEVAYTSISPDSNAPFSPTPQTSSQSHIYFPPAPANLRPPTSFIHARPLACYHDFVQRGREECVGEVADIVKEVGALLGLDE